MVECGTPTESHCVVHPLSLTVWYTHWVSLCGTPTESHCVVHPLSVTVWYSHWVSLCGTPTESHCVVHPLSLTAERCSFKLKFDLCCHLISNSYCKNGHQRIIFTMLWWITWGTHCKDDCVRYPHGFFHLAVKMLWWITWGTHCKDDCVRYPHGFFHLAVKMLWLNHLRNSL